METNVPDDVWPCAYALLGSKDGSPDVKLGCFMVRAETHGEADEKARAYVEQISARFGYPAFHAMVNKTPGEGAVIDLESNNAYRCKNEETTHRYTV